MNAPIISRQFAHFRFNPNCHTLDPVHSAAATRATRVGAGARRLA